MKTVTFCSRLFTVERQAVKARVFKKRLSRIIKGNITPIKKDYGWGQLCRWSNPASRLSCLRACLDLALVRPCRLSPLYGNPTVSQPVYKPEKVSCAAEKLNYVRYGS